MKTITENTVQAGQGRMNIKEIARVAGVSPATTVSYTHLTLPTN